MSDKRFHKPENVPIVKEITGLPEIDKILAQDYSNLDRDSQVVRMWGCRRCWMQGTTKCPYGIFKGKMHPRGYCEMAIKDNLITKVCMGTTQGIEHLMYVNFIETMNMTKHYIGVLQNLKSEDNITKPEILLIHELQKLEKDLNDRLQNILKHREGTKIVHDTVSPDQFQHLFQKAKHVIESKQTKGE